MKFRTFFSAILATLLAAAVAAGSAVALYRIELRDGSRVFAKDRPTHRGSVLLFHQYPGGVLTSVPEEEVVRVVTGAIEARNQTLQPGDVVVLGPTGEGAAQSLPPTTIVKAPALPGGVYDPRNPAFGYSPPRGGVNQPGVTPRTFMPVFPGDLARALSGEPPNLEPSIAPNGFPTTPGSVTPIVGPDGTLILAPPGTPGSTPPVIGPNGTPVLAPSGAPGSTPPPVGPNGYLAPRGPGG